MTYRYDTGIYGGAFDPLHAGHVDCILQAANLCRHLVVILSSGPTRDRISLRERFRWLHQTTCHLPHVRLMVLEDEAPSKAAYGPAMWRRDAEKVRRFVGRPIDVVFCGGDYAPDGGPWKDAYPESRVHVFPRSPASSTALMERPLAHWDWIPREARPRFVKKVLVMGSESTGKSTLVRNLALRFGTLSIQETGREISQRSGVGNDAMMLQDDFTEILLRHKLAEIQALPLCDRFLFVDTDALVTRFYLDFIQAEPGRPDEGAKRCGNIRLAEAVDGLNRYALTLFCLPDVPFVQDGSRNGAIQADRQAYSHRLKALLAASGKPFTVLGGDYQARYEAAVAAVTRLMDEPA